jgi:GntR family transcriptional regulator/MocR family aminotransferase
VAAPAAQGLLMGFTNVATAAEANRLAARLRAAFG